ncbi:MAG: class I SAM-dependent methyltransferase, partial [bacterium]
MSAASLFDFLDDLRDLNYPATWLEMLNTRLTDLEALAKIMDSSMHSESVTSDVWNREAIEDFALKTGKVYSDLWKDFTPDEYSDETLKILRDRFNRNEISIEGIEHALDDGCGGGRYTHALHALGIPKVAGVDISPEAIELGKTRINGAGNSIEFRQSSVLDLPFPDESFDFVFSNGVLHHTESTEKGLEEIYRVLKPGGQVWLYLYGGKESLFWDIVDLCRGLLRDTVPQAYSQMAMSVMGYRSGRIFHRCDFWYVPVHRRYFESEVETMLRDAGFINWRRLLRGADHDWDEFY